MRERERQPEQPEMYVPLLGRRLRSIDTAPRGNRPSIAALLGRTHWQVLPGRAASTIVQCLASPVRLPLLLLLLLLLVCAAMPLATAAGQMESFVKADLRRHDGSDDSLPIMMAIQGIVFDVSSGANFYSKAGPYNQLVGKDASLAVGLMSLEQADLDAEDDISQLDAQGIEDLNSVFYETYVRKYPVLGLATDSRAIPPGKGGDDWLAEVRATQSEAGGPASLQQSKKEL
jgi:hypothetical protein